MKIKENHMKINENQWKSRKSYENQGKSRKSRTWFSYDFLDFLDFPWFSYDFLDFTWFSLIFIDFLDFLWRCAEFQFIQTIANTILALPATPWASMNGGVFMLFEYVWVCDSKQVWTWLNICTISLRDVLSSKFCAHRRRCHICSLLGNPHHRTPQGHK